MGRLLSEYIHSPFIRSTSRYGSNNFIPPRPLIDPNKTSLAVSGSSVWNCLTPSNKNLRTTKCVKRQLQTHLSSSEPFDCANCLLSLTEFLRMHSFFLSQILHYTSPKIYDRNLVLQSCPCYKYNTHMYTKYSGTDKMETKTKKQKQKNKNI